MEFRYKITVFTPTYNRCHTLERLYESLKKQTFTDFEWLIVDDGSTDETEELVTKFKKEQKITITYFKQKNSGKHIAINKGLDLAQGEWFFIVDSDDYLLNDAIQILEKYLQEIQNKKLAGIFFRMEDENGKKIGDDFCSNKFVSNHLDKKYVKGIDGDLAEIFKTEILKRFKFPEFKGESFCAEGLVWNRIALEYNSLFVDEVIYVAEYLNNGLSKNSINNRRKSASYSTLFYKELAECKKIPLVMKIRAIVNFWRFAFFNKRSILSNLFCLENKFLGIVCLPFGVMAKFKDGYTLK